ncbi:MAG: hypothetical protein GOMPHAMPRED_005017 [Gomphillus americanus]|uniref:Uncharacterized protein n=1 Tax=Gomphillus americanus TaxID=1940652 RepID=A0A8H3EN39_9LECA|nr:MAG: hypothetical protein GOMPHAMPRED_005017 [Gomphillus americanus]
MPSWEYFVDLSECRPKNVMLPGKTYVKGGAFVRKRAKSTPKRIATEENEGQDVSDSDVKEEPKKDNIRFFQPSKAAVEAAKRAAATKNIETGSPCGPYDSDSVRERVRNWQSQGGGVVTASNIVVEFEDSENETEFVGNIRSQPASPIKDRWGVRKETISTKQGFGKKPLSPSKGASDNASTQKTPNTPRKRIISDEHWKHKPTPAKGNKDTTPKKNDKKHSYNDGIRVAPIDDEDSKSREVSPGKTPFLDDGIRVYATPPISRRTSDQKEVSGDEAESSSEVDTPISPEPSETVSTDENVTPKTALRDESEKPIVTRKETKRSARGIFGAVLEESKRMFSRTETVYVSQPENPRIDNWLGAIPDLPDDPFINDEKEREESEIAKTPLRRRRKSKVPASDPNGIWDTVSTVDTVPDSAEDLFRRQRRRRSSKPSQDNSSPTKDESIQNKGMQESEGLQSGSMKSSQKHNAQQRSTVVGEESTGAKLRRNTIGIAALQALFTDQKEEQKENHRSISPSQAPIAVSQSTTAGSTPRKPFPSVGGHRLSTIASVDTLNTAATESIALSEISADSNFTAKPKNRRTQNSDPYDKSTTDGPRRKKSRLAKHADLMSVLSMSHNGGKSIKSARSIRAQRTRLDTTTIPDLIRNLTNDETKYMQELRTLVDGVIPVMLASILSKTESKAIANLFSPLGQTSFVSDAIYAMGVALEGLKKWHKRLEPSIAGPVSVTVFLTWAQGVHRIYQDYLKAWRMGFQDVVVNLAPASDTEHKDDAFGHGLPRNKDGDITNTDGERVDVAFLLRRPLVRLKDLAETLKSINVIQSSTLAEKLSADFHGLVVEARRRVYQEKARLEDEAAANIDATRARRIFDLTPQTDVVVNTTRRVRAADYFDLSLLHSNGQRIECGVELLLRDDAPDAGSGADLFICQIDTNDRWLLFPPVDIGNVSARNGDSQGEIIVMLRGIDDHGRNWQELLSMTSDNEQTGFEWVQMLGLVPVPPRLPQEYNSDKRNNTSRILSGTMFSDSVVSDSLASSVSYTHTTRSLSSARTQIPLGEQLESANKLDAPTILAARRDGSKSPSKHDATSTTARASLLATCTSASEDEDLAYSSTSSRDHPNSANAIGSPRSLNEAMSMAGNTNSTLKRNHARKRRPDSMSMLNPPQAPLNEKSPNDFTQTNRVQSSPAQISLSIGKQEQARPKSSKPSLFGQSSSIPDTELPVIPKPRPAMSNGAAKSQESKNVILQADKPNEPRQSSNNEEIPPPPPPHRAPSPIKFSTTPVIDMDSGTIKGKRLSSSPLKYQYEPSSASDDGSETSSAADQDASDDDLSSSDEEDSFKIDDVPELPQQFVQQKRPPLSQPSLPSKTLGPSSSASQAPYKTVPSQPNKALHIAAIVSYWSDKSQWVQLHPDICNIIVAPGLVEIYQISATQSNDAGNTHMQPTTPHPAAQPLLILHLTPMVLLQQGTALDVTVRSPPQGGTMQGTFTSVNFLFRSRSPEEAEILYGVFHHSRMNNPTYIALQQARATAEKPAFDSVFGHNQSRSSSWFSFGRQKSYRASSVPTPKAKSDPSVGTRTTSFSAKLFGSSRFNIARSSIMSRKSPDGSVFTSSDNSMGSGTSSPLPGTISGGNETPLGLSNTKIRLYSREGTRWLDLGSGTLTIMRPTTDLNSGIDLNSPPEIGYAHGVGSNGVISPTQKRGADDKRIVVMKAKKETVLLDVTLGESCFERTARTGIALSLWEIFEGGTVADKGGVTNGRFKYFMMQFQNEAACAFTFSMVGRHRF